MLASARPRLRVRQRHDRPHSMHPRGAGGIFEATRMASFRSLASIRKTPPSCSFVSAKGPSVVNALPFRIRMVVAVNVT